MSNLEKFSVFAMYATWPLERSLSDILAVFADLIYNNVTRSVEMRQIV